MGDPMGWQFVSIEKKNRIAVVRFDRDTATNAVSFALMEELIEAARWFEADDETSAIILTGRADNFSMGFDLKDPETREIAQAGLAQQRARIALGGRMCQAWQAVEPLTIAAIEGWCIGGGLALALACDLRVMSRDGTLYAPEIERGMNMGWGAVPRATALVGPARTKRLFILAEKVGAEQALEWGLADSIAAPGECVTEAFVFADRVAELPPAQVRMIKETVNANALALSGATSALDRDQFALAQRSGDYAEGLASFFGKRDANFTGD